MPTCAETWEEVCELLCANMPRDLALVVIGYWGLPEWCPMVWCGRSPDKSDPTWEAMDERVLADVYPRWLNWWKCQHCSHSESTPGLRITTSRKSPKQSDMP